jgi:adenosylcobinamide-GDP ribazoletransferase
MLSAVSRHVQAFWLALQFLTTLPTPKNLAGDTQLQALSLLWYPAVGLLLGLLLALVCSVLPLPFYLQALLTVTLWIALTGGLHLDGLADCADAWVGGLGDREKTLLLLKDPLCGSMGVIALITVILLKTTALAAVIQQQQLLWMWAVPLLARLSLLFLFLTTRYVRPQGLGEVLAQHFSREWALRVLVGIAIVTLFILPLDVWCAFAMLLLAISLTVRWAAMSRLGGFTGDIAGAQVELVEVGLLLALACRSVA